MKANFDNFLYEPNIQDICKTCGRVQSDDLVVTDGRFKLQFIREEEFNSGPYHFNHFITFFRKADLLETLKTDAGPDEITFKIRDDFCKTFNPNEMAVVEFGKNISTQIPKPTRFTGDLARLVGPIFDAIIYSIYYAAKDYEEEFNKTWNAGVDSIQEEIRKFWPDLADELDDYKATSYAWSSSLYKVLKNARDKIIEMIRDETANTHFDWVSLRVKNAEEPKLLHDHVVAATLWDTFTKYSDPKDMNHKKADLQKVIDEVRDLISHLEQTLVKLKDKYPILYENLKSSLETSISSLETLCEILKIISEHMPEDNGRHFLSGQRAWRFGIWGPESDILYFETAALERFSSLAYARVNDTSKEIKIYNSKTKKYEQIYKNGMVLYGVEVTWLELLKNVTNNLGLLNSSRLDLSESSAYPGASAEKVERNERLFANTYYDYTRYTSPPTHEWYNIFYKFFESNTLGTYENAKSDTLCADKQVHYTMKRIYSLRPENMPRTLADL